MRGRVFAKLEDETSKVGIFVLLLILLAVGVCSTLEAISRPFWFDELCTAIVCRLPTASKILGALKNAADTNPPLFYLAARLGRRLVADDHLGYRLPSIVGLLITISSVYAFLRRRVNPLSALVGTSFILCTPLAEYAYEARPYCLMIGCLSVAVLAWQRTEDSRLYSLLLYLFLTAAFALHYYAILILPLIAIAELSVWFIYRRFRITVWAAIALSPLPILIFRSLLLALQHYYGKNFWAQPGVFLVPGYYSWLFSLGESWGVVLASGIALVSLYWLSNFKSLFRFHHNDEANIGPRPEEKILTLMLLLLPMVATAAAIVGHSGMFARYMLPTVLGGALAFGYLSEKLTLNIRALLLLLILGSYGSSKLNIARQVFHGSLMAQRNAAAVEFSGIPVLSGNSDLPIVISSGIRYLAMAYYTAPNLSKQLYAVTDPRAAVVYSGFRSDSVDLALLELRQYYPLQVVDFDIFRSTHREFLLVVGNGISAQGGPFDWWAARLVHDGDSLQLISVTGNSSIYRVVIKS